MPFLLYYDSTLVGPEKPPALQLGRHRRVSDDLVAKLLIKRHVAWVLRRQGDAVRLGVLSGQQMDPLDESAAESLALGSPANADHVEMEMGDLDVEPSGNGTDRLVPGSRLSAELVPHPLAQLVELRRAWVLRAGDQCCAIGVRAITDPEEHLTAKHSGHRKEPHERPQLLLVMSSVSTDDETHHRIVRERFRKDVDDARNVVFTEYVNLVGHVTQGTVETVRGTFP